MEDFNVKEYAEELGYTLAQATRSCLASRFRETLENDNGELDERREAFFEGYTEGIFTALAILGYGYEFDGVGAHVFEL